MFINVDVINNLIVFVVDYYMSLPFINQSSNYSLNCIDFTFIKIIYYRLFRKRTILNSLNVCYGNKFAFVLHYLQDLQDYEQIHYRLKWNQVGVWKLYSDASCFVP